MTNSSNKKKKPKLIRAFSYIYQMLSLSVQCVVVITASTLLKIVLNVGNFVYKKLEALA